MGSRTRHHLAQANIARMRAPLEDPLMAGFVAQLDGINALADRSRGFVWRLQTDDGNATGIRAFDDERILFNMSVWESIEALHEHAYRSEHVAVFRAPRQWFEPQPAPTGSRRETFPRSTKQRSASRCSVATGPPPRHSGSKHGSRHRGRRRLAGGPISKPANGRLERRGGLRCGEL
jgi:hypothetical protein